MIERGIGYNVCQRAHAPNAGFGKAEDRAVLTAGVPINVPGTTKWIIVGVVE